MNLQLRKINFVQEFLKLNNEKVIDKLEKLLKDEKSKMSKTLSLDELNTMIDEAEEDSKNNRKKKARQLRDEIDSWK